MLIEDLPSDILLEFFSFLSADELRFAGQVNKRWSSTSLESSLWKRLVSTTPGKERLVPVHHLPTTNWKAFYRELESLNRPDSHYESLIAKGLQASSTDGSGNSQSIKQTLARNNKFWSSTGNADPNTNEYLIFQLIQPISIVLSVMIIPFKATFQVGMPIYAPKWLKISVGFSPDKMIYSSDLFPVQNIDEEQRFHLEPKLVFGGFIRLDLIGRYQTQPIDNLFYTVLRYVSVNGIPLGAITEKKTVCQTLTEFALLHSFTTHLPDFGLELSDLQSSQPESNREFQWQEGIAEKFREQLQPLLLQQKEFNEKMVKIHQLLASGNVAAEAIPLLADPNMKVYRTKETIQRLKQSGQIIDYLNALLRSSQALNEPESICLTETAITTRQWPMLQACLFAGLLHPSLAVGDLLEPHNLRLAALVYHRAGVPDKVIEAYILIGAYTQVLNFVEQTNIEPAWVKISLR